MEQVELIDIKTLSGVLPEIILCGVAVLVLLCNLFNANKATVYVVVAGLLIHLAFLFREDPDVFIHFKKLLSFAAIVTILISPKQRTEYFLLLLSILLGADLLIMSTNLVMMLLSMEMISLSSYVLTAGTTPDKRRAEAAWKFFIYGSVATAIMIFGMTYVFSVTGSLDLSHEVFGNITTKENPRLLIGTIMLVAGFLFKMTAAPFYLWAPDVYETAPAPVVAYLSVVPKLAAFVVVMRATLLLEMNTVLAVFAIISIVVGTLAAINQSNSKRMMAFSSVAQAGFLLIFPAAFSLQSLLIIDAAVKFAFYYAIVFAVMNYVVFITIHEQERSGLGTNFSDFSGAGRTNTFAAVVVTLGLVSLAGLPPMAGFMAKLFVFSLLWTKYSETQSLFFLTLFVVGLLATAASLYFYLKIPFYAFFRLSPEKQAIKIPLFTNLLLLILVGLLLALFLAPGLVDGLGY